MAEYSYYNPLQAAEQRKQQAMQRLMMLAQARQQYTNMMYMKQRQQMAEAERKQKEFEGEERKNSTGEFFGGAAGGASIGGLIGSIVPGIGTAIGAGVGALVGGVGGAAMGMSEAKAQYKKEGKHYGAGEFFKSLPGVSDFEQASRGKWDSSYINPRAIGSLGMTAAQIGAANASAQPVAEGPNYAAGETETGYQPYYGDPELGSAGAADYYNALESKNNASAAWERASRPLFNLGRRQ